MVRRLSYKGTPEPSGQHQYNYTRANLSRRETFWVETPSQNSSHGSKRARYRSRLQTQRTKIRHTEKPSHNPRTATRQMQESVVATDSGARSAPSLQVRVVLASAAVRHVAGNWLRPARRERCSCCSRRTFDAFPLEKAQHSCSRHGALTRGPLNASKETEGKAARRGQRRKVQLLQSGERRAPGFLAAGVKELAFNAPLQPVVNSRVSSAGGKSGCFKLKVSTHMHLYLFL